MSGEIRCPECGDIHHIPWWKIKVDEEQEAVEHMAKLIRKCVDEEIIENVIKEAEKEKQSETIKTRRPNDSL